MWAENEFSVSLLIKLLILLDQSPTILTSLTLATSQNSIFKYHYTGIWASAYAFWEDANIQSLVGLLQSLQPHFCFSWGVPSPPVPSLLAPSAFICMHLCLFAPQPSSFSTPFLFFSFRRLSSSLVLSQIVHILQSLPQVAPAPRTLFNLLQFIQYPFSLNSYSHSII